MLWYLGILAGVSRATEFGLLNYPARPAEPALDAKVDVGGILVTGLIIYGI